MSADADAKEVALACRDFQNELRNAGFSRRAATRIVAAWMSRPLPVDLAGMNALYANFAARVRGEE